MIRRSISITALVISSGAAGWYLRHMQKEPGDGARSSAAAPVLARGSTTPSGAPGEGQRGEGAAEKSGPDGMIQVLRQPVSARMFSDFLDSLNQMTPENCDAYRAAWNEYLAGGKPDRAVEKLLNMRVGEVKGAAILKERTGNPFDYKALGAITDLMAGAMTSDADGVRAWFDGLQNEEFRETMLGSYASLLAARDLSAGMKLLAAVPGEFQRQCLPAVVAAARQVRDAAQFSAWLHSTLDAPENASAAWRSGMVREAIAQANQTRQGAPAAAALLEEFIDTPLADLSRASDVAAKYGAWRPMEALNWAQRMEAKVPGTPLLAGVIENAPAEQLGDISGWCQRLPEGPQREAALEALRGRGASGPDQAQER